MTMTARIVPLAVSGVLAATAGLLSAAPALAALTGPQQVAFLNAQRAPHGLPADITENPAMSDGCKKHMDWLATNNIFLQHPETEGTPGYTKEGDLAGRSSVLVKPGDAFSSTGVNAFETAPIHLMQMLSPFIVQSGADRGCLNTLGEPRRTFPAAATFSYPGEGATVPTTAPSYEDPFVPAAAVGLNAAGDVTRSTGTGPHLYFFYSGTNTFAPEWFSRGGITAATLTGPAGPIEIRTVDNNSGTITGKEAFGALGQYLAPGGIVIPVQPLPDNSTFTASVTFQPKEGAAVTRTWSFKTGKGSGGGSGGSGSGGSGGTGGTGGTGTPGGESAPATAPKVTGVKLKSRSVSFTSAAVSGIWITIEKRKGTSKKPKWTTKRSFAASAAAGANRLVLDKLAKATYRVRVRNGSATAKILAEKTLTLR